MRFVLTLIVSLFIGVQAFADGVIEPRKVENVTIKDLYGNPTKLPHFMTDVTYLLSNFHVFHFTSPYFLN